MFHNWTSVKIVIFSVFSLMSAIRATLGDRIDSEHRTKGAIEKLPDLWCYKCSTMTDGEHCRDLIKENSTHFHSKCSDSERICQVKRISLTTINKTGDFMGKPKLWLLQRNCTDSCDSGCVIIGERTKLYSCITCCENSLCNAGSGSDKGLLIKFQFVMAINAFSFFHFLRALSIF